jgi:dTDP-4-amino-4,6-dideoxygalactose transaminase
LIPINDLTRPDGTRQAEAAAIARVLADGPYFAGPATRRFEEDFATYLGVAHCAGVASGTDALTLALAAVGVGPASRVATVANAGFYCSLACRRLGADPVYVDVDPATATMDAARLADVADGSLAAVVVTHLYGQAADMLRLLGVAQRWGVPVIEDCAQAAGARTRGRLVGGFGAAAAFSFYPTKNLGALGDAGAVATSDPDLLARVRSLAQYGWGRRFEVEHPNGMNSRLDEIQAAVLSVRLAGLDERNDVRRSILRTYREALGGFGDRLFFTDDPSHVGHLAVVRVGDRTAARRALWERGIQTEVHYPVPDYRQPLLVAASKPVAAAASLPVTEALAGSVMTVPCFPTMTVAEIAAVADALAEMHW